MVYWKRGAGLGVVITFLFVGPGVNILAIAYTGAAIGEDVVIARIVLSIAFGILIGMTMAWLFRKDETLRPAQMVDSGLFDQQATIKPAVWIVFLMLIGVLIVGTLQVNVLTANWITLRLPVELPANLVTTLDRLNLTAQGALLIPLLVIIGLVAYLGLERVLENFNRWTFVTIALVGLTLLLAAPSFTTGSLEIGLTRRFVGELILLRTIGVVTAHSFERQELANWLWETWKFVRQIFPLLILGVFLAGVVRVIIPESWIHTQPGQNTFCANLIGVIFGVFVYFPTLVEVPIVRLFLDMGMHRGPLLAYLLTDPELSLQISIGELAESLGSARRLPT